MSERRIDIHPAPITNPPDNVAIFVFPDASVLARTVDGDDDTAGVSGTIGCQKDGHVGYFAWPGGAPEREAFHQFAATSRCVRAGSRDGSACLAAWV